MFKKKPIKYNNSYNNKKKTEKNNDTISSPVKQLYTLNKSEPFLFTPQINNKNMAYLMTPCYIVDNDDLNIKTVKEYNRRIGKDLINGYFLSSPQKSKMFYRTKSSEFLKNEDPFYYTYMKNASNRKNNDNRNDNFNYNLYSDGNKFFIPSYGENSSLFDNNIRRIENRSRITKIKRPNSSDKKLISLNKNQLFFDSEPFPNFYDSSDNNNLYNKFIKRNRNKNPNEMIYLKKNNDIFTLGGENNIDKGNTRNKSKKSNNSNKKKNNLFDLSKNYRNQNVNRQILNHLYDNNYMNNNIFGRQSNNFAIKNNKKNKNDDYMNYNNNILNTNTDRKNTKNYSIFKNDNVDILKQNKSIYNLYPNKENNKDHPYNKILNMGKISSINFALINSGKKNNQLDIENKKRNSSNSNNNVSNNSNSQSNNLGANHISTNYTGVHSYYSSNRDNQMQKQIENNKSKKGTNKSVNSSKPVKSLEVSPVFSNEYFRDSIGKKSNTSSNKVSLQSLSDSKMLELAGHYGFGDESSSDNYQMNNVIHNKKNFYKYKV